MSIRRPTGRDRRGGSTIVPAFVYEGDFRSVAASYPGVTISRTGASMRATLTTTTVGPAIGNDTPIVEDAGDGIVGPWVFPNFVNHLPDAFDNTSATGGWTLSNAPTTTANAGTAPDGTATADRLACASAGTVQSIYRNTGAAGLRMASVWVKDDTTSAPTSPGCCSTRGSAPLAGTSYGANTGLWRRIQNFDTSGNFWNHYGPGTGNNQAAPVAADTGDYLLWGAQCVTTGAANVDLPLCATNAGTGDCTMVATNFGDWVQGGDFDVEVQLGPRWASLATTTGGVAANFYFLAGTGSEGELSLRYVQASDTVVLMVRGVDVLTVAAPSTTQNQAQGWRRGDALTVRAWYRVSTGACGVRFTVNGVTSPDKTGTTSGSALAALTSGVICGKSGAGANTAYAKVMQFRIRSKASVPVTPTPEIVLLGDSIVASYQKNICSGADIYTTAQRDTRAGIAYIAMPGNTIAQQLTAWNASDYSSQSPAAVIIQAGINDVNAGTASATVLTSLQTLVTQVRADCPSTKIILSYLTPCLAYQTGIGFPGYNAVRNAVNAGLAGLTSVDAVTSSHATTIDDGSGNLAAAYNNGDNLHPNNAGRSVMGAAWLVTLQAQGVLP